jgi:hypothetical protein
MAIGPSQGRYIHAGQHKQYKRAQIPISIVGFEPTTPEYERATTVHALAWPL